MPTDVRNVTYLAQQSAGRVTIIATGRHRATGYETYFLETPRAASPPEYRVIHQRGRGLALRGLMDFMSHVSFSASDVIERVVVHDEAGRHEIEVLQIRAVECISQLFVNGTCIQVKEVSTNSLTPDACERYDVDSVDMHAGLSDLNEISLPIIGPDTYSLIYFVTGEVHLTAPISAATCLRLKDAGGGNTSADVFVYDAGEYTKQDFGFSLDGVLGCTALANLGFCLLKRLHDITTRALSTVTISDRAWVDKYEDADLKVADGPIYAFCRSAGVEKVSIGASNSDCDDWTACKGMEGIRCVHTKPKCK